MQSLVQRQECINWIQVVLSSFLLLKLLVRPAQEKNYVCVRAFFLSFYLATELIYAEQHRAAIQKCTSLPHKMHTCPHRNWHEGYNNKE